MPDEEAITRWTEVWLAESERQQAATKRAREQPHNDALEMARWEANGKLHDLECKMTNEVLLLLRKAHQTRPGAIRELLRDSFIELIEEVLPEMVKIELGPFRKAFAEMSVRLKELEAAKVAKPLNGVQVPTQAIPAGKRP